MILLAPDGPADAEEGPSRRPDLLHNESTTLLRDIEQITATQPLYKSCVNPTPPTTKQTESFVMLQTIHGQLINTWKSYPQAPIELPHELVLLPRTSPSPHNSPFEALTQADESVANGHRCPHSVEMHPRPKSRELPLAAPP